MYTILSHYTCMIDICLHYYYTTYCKHYGISECTMNYSQMVLGRFIRGPDDDSKESKHVALRQQIIIKLFCFYCHLYVFIVISRAWGGVVVKALRYQLGGPGMDSRWCHWGFFPSEPCALRSTQPLKVNTRDFSWGKGGRCVWLTTYHHCNAETSRKSGALTYPESFGPPRPVAGHLYFTLVQCIWLPMFTMLKVYKTTLHQRA